MKRAWVILATAIFAAGLWWAFPWQFKNGRVDLASLGPREACGCAASPSPPIRKWTACAVRALDKAGKLDEAIIPADHVQFDPLPKDVPERFNKVIKQVAEGECGSFAQALTLASDLETRRREVGYEDYLVFSSPAGMFVGWEADDLRMQARDVENEFGKS